MIVGVIYYPGEGPGNLATISYAFTGKTEDEVANRLINYAVTHGMGGYKKYIGSLTGEIVTAAAYNIKELK